VLLVAAFLTATNAISAGAHGGKQRLALAPAGSWVVSAWTSPDPPRVGRLDVSVAVLRSRTREPEPNAIVQVSARRPGANDTVRATAVLDPGGVFGFFSMPLAHATLPLSAEGPWRITVAVSGTDGDGAATFEIDVAPPAAMPWTVLVATVVAMVVAFMVWRVRPRDTRAARPDDDSKGEVSR